LGNADGTNAGDGQTRKSRDPMREESGKREMNIEGITM